MLTLPLYSSQSYEVDHVDISFLILQKKKLRWGVGMWLSLASQVARDRAHSTMSRKPTLKTKAPGLRPPLPLFCPKVTPITSTSLDFKNFLQGNIHPAPAGPSGRALPALPSPAPTGPAQDLCSCKKWDPGFHGPRPCLPHPRARTLTEEDAVQVCNLRAGTRQKSP